MKSKVVLGLVLASVLGMSGATMAATPYQAKTPTSKVATGGKAGAAKKHHKHHHKKQIKDGATKDKR
ncbi:MAG TPA: hypothetical protein PLL06_18765 [Acidobacteriota bacterium]|nr:hypothetical protein [Acidobacteriota bacterium]HNB70710.1 hypothetical protein [Acidobacteriota bacterium]HNG92643.1 hypothetical protein [Acidobacteriota bacterium]HNJ42493.1 hypothetical protein [Acidobacteriota bacterium]